MVTRHPTACVRIAAFITAIAVASVMMTIVKNLGVGFESHAQAYEAPSMTLLASVCLADDVEDTLDDVLLNDSTVESSSTKPWVASRRPWMKPYQADDRPLRPPID